MNKLIDTDNSVVATRREGGRERTKWVKGFKYVAMKDQTLGGKHAIEDTDILLNCASEVYVMLLTNVTQINLIKKPTLFPVAQRNNCSHYLCISDENILLDKKICGRGELRIGKKERTSFCGHNYFLVVQEVRELNRIVTLILEGERVELMMSWSTLTQSL